jgi:pentatricopeptide repeat protein
VLNACASVVALEDGRCVHQQIVECGWDSNVFVANSLVDMYAKCGSIEDALRVFNKMSFHDAVSWNAMILECTGMVRKLLNFLNRCAKKVYSQMI